jgi:PKD repeat protein
MHSRPIIDWGHGSTGPARTGTFSGKTATVINIGAAGSPVSGPQFGGSAAIVGGFYPHNDFPAEYQNTLFFGDYASRWIRNITVNGKDNPIKVRNFINSGAVVVAMATHPNEGGLYYIHFPSEIRKVTYNTANRPPVAVASSNKSFGPSPLAVQFTGSASSDPDGQPLTYQWNFGDGSTSTLANPSHTFTTATTAPTMYTVTLTVRDSQGSTAQASLVISLNNTPPQVTITSLANNTQYSIIGGNITYPLRATVSDQSIVIISFLTGGKPSCITTTMNILSLLILLRKQPLPFLL